MRIISVKTSLLTVGMLASIALAKGQVSNQAAVDTLTKEVATAVFAGINQPKAQEIYTQLLTCGDDCDAQQIIRSVGSWDQVGQRMQELSQLRDTKAFIGMKAGEANAAIRQQLAQFYQRNKVYESYRNALPPSVQQQILTKIDRLLPPAEAVEPSPASRTQPDADALSPAAGNEEAAIDPAALQQSRLERELRETNEKQRWMMIVSGIVGLLVGAGAVYLLLYRGAQAEVKELRKETNQLRNSLESTQRNKAGSDSNPIRPDHRKKVSAYDAIVAELGTDNPLTTIRQLKQQAAATSPKPTPAMRSGEARMEPGPAPEPDRIPEPVPPPAPLMQTSEPVEAAPRSEVFYFPPPDPTGLFDLSQKSGALSPESAYRFSVSAENPAVASFRFEADPGRLARFLTYRNYMIEPACESENTYTTTHTRVAMRRDGEAMLNNGAWRVKTKALIRYE